MNRFRLATSATLVGAMLAAGCVSPCGGGGCGVFHRLSMFRARRACPCPCECCSSCGGGAPFMGGGESFMGAGGPYMGGGGPFMGGGGSAFGDGPLLEPQGSPLTTLPPPPGGMATPAPFPPSLGAPLGTPSLPADPGRITPIPNGAQPFPAGPSSRLGRR